MQPLRLQSARCARRPPKDKTAKVVKQRYCALLAMPVRCVLPAEAGASSRQFGRNLEAMSKVIARNERIARVRAQQNDREYTDILARQAERKRESLQWQR